MRPKILDLFCCEGGAARGYDQAGFDVYGIDLNRQRRYPYPFLQADAIETMKHLIAGGTIEFSNGEVLSLADFDAIHASPPCQAYSVTKHSHGKSHPELLEPTREVLIASGLPYVIENVVGAPLIDPVVLCWTHFREPGSVEDVDGTPLQMRRHRLFESSVELTVAGECNHPKGIQTAGAYGGGSADREYARHIRRGGYTPNKEIRARLLEIDWMTVHGLSQSIPPMYSKHVGEQLLEAI